MCIKHSSAVNTSVKWNILIKQLACIKERNTFKRTEMMREREREKNCCRERARSLIRLTRFELAGSNWSLGFALGYGEWLRAYLSLSLSLSLCHIYIIYIYMYVYIYINALGTVDGIWQICSQWDTTLCNSHAIPFSSFNSVQLFSPLVGFFFFQWRRYLLFYWLGVFQPNGCFGAGSNLVNHSTAKLHSTNMQISIMIWFCFPVSFEWFQIISRL